MPQHIDEILADIQAGKKASMYVFTAVSTGRKALETDAYLADLWLDQLVTALFPDPDDRALNLISFNGNGRDFRTDPVLEELRSSSFFGGGRVVVVRQFPTVKKKSGGKKKKQGDESIFDSSLFADGNVLIVATQTSLSAADQKLLGKQDHAVIIDTTSPPSRDMGAVLAGMARRRDCRLESDASHLLMELIGPILPILWMEICKLSDYIGDRDVITADDVANVCAETRQHDVFTVIDAIAAQDARKTFHELDRLFNQQVQPLQLVSLLSMQFRRLLQLRGGLDQGMSMADAGQAAGLPAWLARKMSNAARQFSTARSAHCLGILRLTDKELKTLRTPPRLVFENQVLRLLGR
ncbi:MAG: DNA polymerase III subunit delta [Myxococcales bacterium]|nr:DNA polymerase III subunit delta [Myxococcales bacterium]